MALFQHASTELELFSERFEDTTKQRHLDNTIAKTWHISFDHIRRQDPLAAEYLSLIACLNRTNIPLSLLAFKGSSVQQVKALGTLTGYAFLTERQLTVEESDEDRSFDMHRLVHMASIWWLDETGQRKTWADTAIARLEKLVPDGDFERNEVWRLYLPHVTYLARLDNVLPATARGALLHRLGRCQVTLGQYSSAVASSRQAVLLRERALGPNDADTLYSMANLAIALGRQGTYTEAEAVYRQLLARYEKLPVPENWTLRISLSLGEVLGHQGKYGEAKALLERVLARREIIGPEEARLAVLGSLAHVLEREGNKLDAEILYRQVLEGRKKLFGSDHALTLASLWDLAGLLTFQTKATSKEAEAMYRRVLTQIERDVGYRHPYRLTALANIAESLKIQGRCEESRGLYREVLVQQSEVLGPEHPQTLMTMYSLARVLNEQGEIKEAEELHLQALVLREKVLGPEHPDTLMSGGDLGLIFAHQQRYEESVAMFKKTYAGYVAVYGLNHPFSRHCLNDYMDAMEKDRQSRRDQSPAIQDSTASSRSTSRESRLRRGLAKMGIGSPKSSAGK